MFACLPHRAFGHLAIAEQHVRPVVRLDAARVERDADGGADPLTERSGGDVDERQPRRRVPFEIASRCGEASAALPAGTGRPRPRRRRESAPRGLSTARSGRCRGSAAPSGRSASRRRRAWRRSRRRRGTCVGCPLPASLVERTESMRSCVAALRRAGTEISLISGRSVSPEPRGPPRQQVVRGLRSLRHRGAGHACKRRVGRGGKLVVA